MGGSPERPRAGCPGPPRGRPDMGRSPERPRAGCPGPPRGRPDMGRSPERGRAGCPGPPRGRPDMGRSPERPRAGCPGPQRGRPDMGRSPERGRAGCPGPPRGRPDMKASDGYPVRLRFTKLGKVRFISHRDVARAFERAFRIEALPLAFTQGFSPRPKVSFGLALSVGHESAAEYLDVELAEEIDVDPLGDRLAEALPPGIDVTGMVALRERAPALQEAVTQVDYDVA